MEVLKNTKFQPDAIKIIPASPNKIQGNVV